MELFILARNSPGCEQSLKPNQNTNREHNLTQATMPLRAVAEIAEQFRVPKTTKKPSDTLICCDSFNPVAPGLKQKQAPFHETCNETTSGTKDYGLSDFRNGKSSSLVICRGGINAADHKREGICGGLRES
jgi:hypothetical protein